MSHGMRLTAFEPIAGLIITADRRGEGWELWLRHRHHSGHFSDCEAEVYTKLSTQEFCDVLEAAVRGLIAVPGPGDPGY